MISSLGNLLSQLVNKYPYTTIDDDGHKIVIMTVEQADLINRKYKELQDAYSLIQTDYSKLDQEHSILKHTLETLGDTVVQQLHLIREQRDTITKYVTVINDTKLKQDTSVSQYTALQDSLWKWSLGPSLIYTEYPVDSVVYVLDLSEHYMTTDDFGIVMVKMSDREYKKYQEFVKMYGLDEKALWEFRNDMKIRRLTSKDITRSKTWKYKSQWKRSVTN